MSWSRLAAVIVGVSFATGLPACSDSNETTSEQPDASMQDAGPCGPNPGVVCKNKCTGKEHAPEACIGNKWQCNDPFECPEGGTQTCSTLPDNVSCTDHCGRMADPECVNGSWDCPDVDADAGCPDAAPAKFACGTAECKVGVEICRMANKPPFCPEEPTDAACPVGCPGCEPLPDPTCQSAPSACAGTMTCDCLLTQFCGSSQAGACLPKNGGITLQCSAQ